MERYRIRHHIDEAECQQCGCPLYVGDTAYLDGQEVYCSPGCVSVARVDADYARGSAGVAWMGGGEQ